MRYYVTRFPCRYRQDDFAGPWEGSRLRPHAGLWSGRRYNMEAPVWNVMDAWWSVAVVFIFIITISSAVRLIITKKSPSGLSGVVKIRAIFPGHCAKSCKIWCFEFCENVQHFSSLSKSLNWPFRFQDKFFGLINDNLVPQVTDGIVDVIMYPSAANKSKNRGFAFVEYSSHRAAAMARRKLIPGRIQLFGHQIAVDWAKLEKDVDEDVMNGVCWFGIFLIYLSLVEISNFVIVLINSSI